MNTLMTFCCSGGGQGRVCTTDSPRRLRIEFDDNEFVAKFAHDNLNTQLNAVEARLESLGHYDIERT